MSIDLITKIQHDASRNGSMMIGCYVKKPHLIHEMKLDGMELDTHTAFFYALFNGMIESGYVKFDEASIESYVQQDPAKYQRYSELGGYDTLKGISQVADVDNAEGYINGLAKANMLLQVKDKFDIQKLYTISTKADATKFHSYLDYIVTTLDSDVLSKGEYKDITVTENDIQEMNDGVALGISYENVLPSLNKLTLGIPKGNLTIIGSYVNQGKSSLAAELLFDSVSQGNKVGLIANEMSKRDYQELLLMYVIRKHLSKDNNYSNKTVAEAMTRTTLSLGHFTTSQLEVLKDASKIIKESYAPNFKMLETFDYNTDEAVRAIRNWSKQGVVLVVYDTLKADIEDRDTWKNLIQSTRNLYQVAHEEKDIAVVGVMQIALSTLGRRVLSLNMLANGKQAVEPASEVIMFRDVLDDEYAGESNALQVWTEVQDETTGATKNDRKEIEFIRQPNKQYRIFFTTKSRKGQTGQSFLYEFKGSTNEWIEVGRCLVSSRD